MIEPRVTDHAELRYLERVYGVDVEGLRARIAQAAAKGCEHNAGAIIIDGTRFVLDGNCVVTVTGHGKTSTKRAARHRARQGK